MSAESLLTIPLASLNHLHSVLIQPLFTSATDSMISALKHCLPFYPSLTSIAFTEWSESREPLISYLPLSTLSVVDLADRNRDQDSYLPLFQQINDLSNNNFKFSEKLQIAKIGKSKELVVTCWLLWNSSALTFTL